MLIWNLWRGLALLSALDLFGSVLFCALKCFSCVLTVRVNFSVVFCLCACTFLWCLQCPREAFCAVTCGRMNFSMLFPLCCFLGPRINFYVLFAVFARTFLCCFRTCLCCFQTYLRCFHYAKQHYWFSNSTTTADQKMVLTIPLHIWRQISAQQTCAEILGITLSFVVSEIYCFSSIVWKWRITPFQTIISSYSEQ